MAMNPDALRKAAILISALDHRSGDALLDQMPPDQADRVAARSWNWMQSTRPSSKRSSGSSFGQAHSAAAPTSIPTTAWNWPFRCPRRHASPTSRKACRPASRPRTDRSSCATFHQADSGQLVALLCQEHPQTIAVVTSQLSPPRTSELLLRMPDSLQMDVLRRIAALGDTDPEIVQEIQQALDMRLSGRLPTQRAAATGIATLRAILEAADQKDRQSLIAKLAGDDPGLAQQLQSTTDLPLAEQSPRVADQRPACVAAVPWSSDPAKLPTEAAGTGRSPAADSPCRASRPAPKSAPAGEPARLDFADLVTLDDAALASIFRRAAPEVALIALAGAQDELVRRILRQLSPRQARRLQRQMCQLGPIRLRDVEPTSTN